MNQCIVEIALFTRLPAQFLQLTGLLIKSSAGADGAKAGLWLAALQWGAFVAPTLWLVKQQGWDLKQTLRVQPASPGLVMVGAARLLLRLAQSIRWAVDGQA